jgi:hypothetical protein
MINKAILKTLTVIYILKGSTPTIFHANPQFVPAQVAAIICNYVWVPAILHHKDFLLDDGKVIT